eukprot:c21493_g3_i1 orf=58-348(-)
MISHKAQNQTSVHPHAPFMALCHFPATSQWKIGFSSNCIPLHLMPLHFTPSLSLLPKQPCFEDCYQLLYNLTYSSSSPTSSPELSVDHPSSEVSLS